MDASIWNDAFHQDGDVCQNNRAKGEREMWKTQTHEEVATMLGRGVQAGKERDGPPDWRRHRKGSKGLKKKMDFLAFGYPPTGPGVRGCEITGYGDLFVTRRTKL